MRIFFISLFLFLFIGCGIVGLNPRADLLERNFYHLVKAGETLNSIAEQHGISPIEIALLNNIRDKDELLAGEKLLLAVVYRPQGSSSSSISNLPTKGIVPYRGGKLHWPVDGGRLVSNFGPRSGKFHDGIDIASPIGTAVFSAHSGEVAYVGSKLRGYGKLVIVRDDDGITTVYAHNRRILVREGQHVKRGQKIAEIGMTGRTTGPHLHFEVRMKDGYKRHVAVDPIPLLKKGNNEKPRFRVNGNLNPILAKAKP